MELQKRSGDQLLEVDGSPDQANHKGKEKYDVVEGESLIYSVEDTPQIHVSALLGLQHFSTMFLGQVACLILISGPLCVGTDWEGRAQILSTIVFAAGLSTMLQSTIGIRLPIIQGASPSYIAPLFAILSQDKWSCPVAADNSTVPNVSTVALLTSAVNTTSSHQVATQDQTPPWHFRMREIQGALIVASLFQVLLGVSGVLGLLLRFVTPMVISVVISLIGISIMPIAAQNSATSWPISVTTMFLCILFSQYLRNLKIPLFSYSRTKKCNRTDFPVFSVFPILISLAIVWTLSVILTSTDVLSLDIAWQRNARTDTRSDVLQTSAWFRIPYPFQWGMPTFTISASIGMCVASLTSVIESIGDYHACGKISGAPPPPVHACNRGIGIEGLGVLFCGLLGAGLGVTSYSENIAFVLITKVSSRRVAQMAGIWMIILGIFGKFGALFATVPDPIIGGTLFFSIGMVSSAGISYLQYVNMNSPRNLFILGFSLCAGIGVPSWLISNPDAIDTGKDTVDQLLAVLLRTNMLVGGIVAVILDNTVPGMKRNSSLLEVMKRAHGQTGQTGGKNVYNLPFVTSMLKRQKWTYYVPFCPTYTARCLKTRKTTTDP